MLGRELKWRASCLLKGGYLRGLAARGPWSLYERAALSVQPQPGLILHCF